MEFTDKSDLQKVEQKYQDLDIFDYNTAKFAGNTTGVKHSEETKEKMSANRKGKTHSEETKAAMSANRRGANNNFYGKIHSPEALAKIKAAVLRDIETGIIRGRGFKVEILDCITQELTVHKSIAKAAKYLGCSTRCIKIQNDTKQFYKERYLIDYKQK